MWISYESKSNDWKLTSKRNQFYIKSSFRLIRRTHRSNQKKWECEKKHFWKRRPSWRKYWRVENSLRMTYAKTILRKDIELLRKRNLIRHYEKSYSWLNKCSNQSLINRRRFMTLKSLIKQTAWSKKLLTLMTDSEIKQRQKKVN